MPRFDPSLGFSLAHAPSLALLVVVGALAGAINAVAGGGSLLSFPLLVAFGVSPLVANATNSLSLWPGSLSSALGFVNLLPKTRPYLLPLLVPTLLGGAIGACLLVSTSDALFRLVVPALLLVATLLLALQPALRKRSAGKPRTTPRWVGLALQLLISVYGGYFGAGMGILMLSVFGLFIEANLHELNALKTWLSLAVNLVASALFLSRGLVALAPGLSLMAGSIAGGYLAARHSQRLRPGAIRAVTIAFGAAMTLWFARALF